MKEPEYREGPDVQAKFRRSNFPNRSSVIAPQTIAYNNLPAADNDCRCGSARFRRAPYPGVRDVPGSKCQGSDRPEP